MFFIFIYFKAVFSLCLFHLFFLYIILIIIIMFGEKKILLWAPSSDKAVMEAVRADLSCQRATPAPSPARSGTTLSPAAVGRL